MAEGATLKCSYRGKRNRPCPYIAEWQIGNFALSCTRHVGYVLARAAGKQMVYPIVGIKGKPR